VDYNISANLTGETDKGEKVLSTTNFKLCFGDFDKPAISATSNNGLRFHNTKPSCLE
jgi:hypothetical protein